MVRNLVAAVGTGYDNGNITGHKSVFAYNEQIYCVNHCDGLIGNELFKIEWQRNVSGTWTTQVTNTWQNQGYTDAYQWAWIQNYTPGEWRVRCYCGAYGPWGESFTINPASKTVKETIGWQANVSSGSHNFYLISLYGTNTNNTIGGFQISQGAYIIINTSSMSRYDYITTSSVSKYDCLTIVAENYNSSTGAISGIYDYWIQNAVI